MGTTPIVPQISDVQKKTIEAIVNVFETGSPRGNYGAVTLLPGDSGHLTYGRSQTTLASGNLYVLLLNYLNSANARYGSEIAFYLGRVGQPDFSLDTDSAFHALLKLCGEDPVMQLAQDAFFDNSYWQPALKAGAQLHLTMALSYGVSYDSHIQGAWATIVEKTNATVGAIGSGATEQGWIRTYVNTRKAWLTARSPLLAKTTYRMDAFNALITSNKWSLELPISFLRYVIDQSDLGQSAPIRVAAEDSFPRLLFLTDPFLSGPDVVRVQQALQQNGLTCGADGIYGNYTAMLVRVFQRRNSLTADGIVGPITRQLLLGN